MKRASSHPIRKRLNALHQRVFEPWKLIQEASRERRHLHVCDLWLWVVTLTLSQGQKGLCNIMSFIVVYLGTRYDVCDVIICEIWQLVHFLLPLTFACDLLRPSRSLSFLSLDGRYVVVFWFQVWVGQTHPQTHRQTDTQTNCSKNITPPRFRGGVITPVIKNIHKFLPCVLFAFVSPLLVYFSFFLSTPST